MRKILLVCGAGMSTSLLVKKMQEVDKKHEYLIHCCDVLSAKIKILDNDILLLAPHISYMETEFLSICENNHIPFFVIDQKHYSKMDGEAVLNKVAEYLDVYEKEIPFHVVMLHGHTGVMTDLIVLDMNKKRNNDEKTWIIESISIDTFGNDETYHVILLEPQICFEEAALRKKMSTSSSIISVPSKEIYSSFNGRKMLDYIHQICEEKKEQEKKELKEGLEKL